MHPLTLKILSQERIKGVPLQMGSTPSPTHAACHRTEQCARRSGTPTPPHSTPRAVRVRRSARPTTHACTHPRTRHLYSSLLGAGAMRHYTPFHAARYGRRPFLPTHLNTVVHPQGSFPYQLLVPCIGRGVAPYPCRSLGAAATPGLATSAFH